MTDLNEILRTAWPAFAILGGAHTSITLARAYVRYKVTENEYPERGFLDRLPRCFARRILNPETFGYTALVGSLAITAYYLLKYTS